MSKSLTNVLIAPHVSEKAMGLADKQRRHVFVVDPRATKKAVRAAVEKMFEVEVESVSIVNMKGKTKGRLRRGGVGRRKNWKKAYIKLRENFDIQWSESE